MDNFIPSIYSVKDIVAIGITNQRETVVVWDKYTGRPLHNAIGKFAMDQITFNLIWFTFTHPKKKHKSTFNLEMGKQQQIRVIFGCDKVIFRSFFLLLILCSLIKMTSSLLLLWWLLLRQSRLLLCCTVASVHFVYISLNTKQ